MSDTCGLVVEHCRDSKFHLVYVPAINQYTQARSHAEIGPTARELFAYCTGVPIDEVYVIEYRTHTPPDTIIEDDMAKLICDCGQEYEIRDDTPGWAAPWCVCPECFLMDGEVGHQRNLT